VDTGKGEAKTRIKIDKESFTVEATSLTGRELRNLPNPPIGPERDLYLAVPGPGEDRRIGDDEAIELKDGMHFFTAPATITPGQHASSR
jgi:hypothetical protein